MDFGRQTTIGVKFLSIAAWIFMYSSLGELADTGPPLESVNAYAAGRPVHRSMIGNTNTQITPT